MTVTEEYLQGILNKARALMSSDKFELLHRFARSSAGGRIKSKNYAEQKKLQDSISKADDHVHELPSGSFTGKAIEKESGHVHQYDGEKETGPPIGDELIHRHELQEEGKVTGGPVIAVAKSMLGDLQLVNKDTITLFDTFTPPTSKQESFISIDDAVLWASSRYPVATLTALNGFRMIVHKSESENRVEAYFEDDLMTDVAFRFPEFVLSMKAIPGDFILDTDLGIRKAGKRLFQPDIDKLKLEKPRLAEGESFELTIMDMPYFNGDISNQSFAERRELLESFFADDINGKVPMARLSKSFPAKTEEELIQAIKKNFSENQSVGVYIALQQGPYDTGMTDDLALLIKDKLVLKSFSLSTHLALAALGYELTISKSSDEAAIDTEELTTEDIKDSRACPIFKADDEQRLIYGIVLEPDTVDSHGDKISADEIQKSAHFFLKKSRVIGLGHTKIANASPVESYLSPIDFEIDGPFGNQKIQKGTWILGIHVPDDSQWEDVKSGKYEAFSVGGFGLRDK